MVETGRLLPIAVAVAVLLAGCAAQSSAPRPVGSENDPAAASSARPAESSEGTCGIEGTVVDQDYLPVPGAQVSLLSAEQDALAAVDGRFSFSFLPAGQHQLVASMNGYDSATARVDCPPGAVLNDVTLLLHALPKVEPPFYFSNHASGRIGCAWGFVYQSPDLCQRGWANANNPGLDPQAKSTIAFRPDPRATRITGAVYEVKWERTQGFGSDYLKLEFSLSETAVHPVAKSYCAKTRDTSFNGYNVIRGPSVLCTRLNPESQEDTLYLPAANGTWNPLTFKVLDTANTEQLTQSPTTWQDESSKLVVGQTFDLYVTWFYNGARAPEGFTALG